MRYQMINILLLLNNADLITLELHCQLDFYVLYLTQNTSIFKIELTYFKVTNDVKCLISMTYG
jgi:hypothetical protein